MQPVAQLSTGRSIIIYISFGNLGLSNFRTKDKNEDMGIESSFTKAKLLIENLTEEILTIAALRETEFEYQNKSDENSIFGYFGSAGFRSEELDVFFGNEVNF